MLLPAHWYIIWMWNDNSVFKWVLNRAYQCIKCSIPSFQPNNDAKQCQACTKSWKISVITAWRRWKLTEMMILWTRMDPMEATETLLGWGINSPRAVSTGLYILNTLRQAQFIYESWNESKIVPRSPQTNH